jgi:hypothetical protein
VERSGNPTSDDLPSDTYCPAMSGPNRLACSAALVGLLTLAACGSSDNGTIAGVFYGIGNVKTHVGGVPSSGTIRVTGPDGTFTAVVRDNGRYSLTVPAGTYQVAGRAPSQTGGISSCRVPNVHVVAGQTKHVAVTCVFH